VALAQDLALDQPFIRVSGTGKVSVPPDLALINLGVETQAKSAEEARALAATSMTAVLDAVRAMRIEEKDLQTNWVTLYPVYAPNTANRITGYQVQNQLTVKVRDLARVGTVLDEAVKAGGDAARMQGLIFAVEDTATAQTAAREKAYADAQAKALEYARHAGVTIGKPIRIQESSAFIPPPVPLGGVAMARMAADAVTPVQTGEQEIAVSVDVVFAIEQPAP